MHGRVEPFHAVEVIGSQRERVVAAYRKALGRSVTGFFARIPDPGDHPVFRIEPSEADVSRRLNGASVHRSQQFVVRALLANRRAATTVAHCAELTRKNRDAWRSPSGDPADPWARPSRPPACPGRGRARALAAIGLLTITLALAPTAMAAGLSLTTPYPAVSVAPGSKVTFSITVSANPSQQVAVSVTGAPADWKATLRGGGYVVNGIQTDEAGKATLSLEVQVPATATDGVTHLTVAGVAGGVRADLPLAITVSGAMAGDVTLTSDVPSLQGASGSSFTFNLTLQQRQRGGPHLRRHRHRADRLGGQRDPHRAGAGRQRGGQGRQHSAVSVSAKPPTDVAPETYPIDVKATVGDRTIDAQLSVKVTGTNALTVTTPDAAAQQLRVGRRLDHPAAGDPQRRHPAARAGRPSPPPRRPTGR